MPPRRPQPKPGILAIAPYVGGKSKAKGRRAIKLSSNESPLGPSPKACKAFIESAKRLHRYPDGNATALRQAISKVHGIPPERIICGAGSDELIAFLVHAYAGPGDEVLYTEHGFLMYKIYAQGAGATPVAAPEKNLRTDVDALLKCVTPRTKIVFLANPNNPTGSYISKKELARLHQGLPPQVILAVDGAYAEYAENSPSPLEGEGWGGGRAALPHPLTPSLKGRGIGDYTSGRELADKAENVVMLRTFSKIYGLSALRVGWAYAPAAIIDVLNRIRGPFNVSQPGQDAAAAAMLDKAFTAKAAKFNARWLAWLSREIGKLGLKVFPSIANFILVEFPKGKHSAANASAFLMQRGLIVREVGNYGLPDCLRISVGLEADNRAVVAALHDFLK